MSHLTAVSSFLRQLNRLKDPNAWVCLIAVFVVLGLLGGAFEPAEQDRLRDAGLGDGAAPQVLHLARADQPS
ncbi:hypothetical protein J7U46_09200 [Pelomonas sp. V22]|uniref:hypothetical protein n=1 Tax=Pelomonas sp. V22 TaxID=2822139 RepID=UPI0024A9358B|nr:hypothetical protein [Pelomonas sp. V22]MDI4633221.1 hypothetical protein [Pelomonas sp. V22]